MAKEKFIWVILAGIALTCQSCEYAHFNGSLEKSNCDTLSVTYAKSVKPILEANCYSCHSTSVTSATDGFDLEKFSSLKDYLNLTYANDGIYGSKFSHSINQQGYLLYMPPTYKLTKCQLTIINKWIKAGAPEN